MANRPIEVGGKLLTVHKAVTEPHFGEKTILVTDTWDYIALWLKRHHHTEARFFWDQARSFYAATLGLPKDSSPLTAYYCMLNAVKALLLVKKVKFSDRHGVTGSTIGQKSSLSNEIVQFKPGGILAEMCRHLGEVANNEQYSLRDLLYNLPFVHRAFDLSVESSPELFVPIRNPRIVRSRTTNEAWFCADLEGRYATLNTLKRLPSYFERDNGESGRFVIRSKKRFNWVPSQKTASLKRYVAYHRGLRQDLSYIHSPQRLWYLKRSGNVRGYISRSTMTLSFAAMHKLSELARYAPQSLDKHFDGRYNWLLSEFIAIAPIQFLDEVSCEMTGQEFMPPGRVA